MSTKKRKAPRKCDVSVSTIIMRTDNKILNEKGIEVNSYLKELCKKKEHFPS